MNTYFARATRLVLFIVFFPLSIAVAVGPVVDSQQARPDEENDLMWYDIRQLDVEGQGWAGESTPFTRLPDRAKVLVRKPVWGLSRKSAGLCVRFVTDTKTIRAAWELRSGNLAMPHMPATGISGLDLYVRGNGGAWRWLAVGKPTAKKNTAILISGMPAGEREYLLYLPLYNGVSSVEIGLPKGSRLAKADPYPAGREKPIIFYGTSITQGGCASRAGMVHAAILGRRFNRPVVNLGFSGNGKMEAEIAELMTELDAAVYVVDCLPNITADQVRERTEPLVHTLRAKHPKTPILLVEDPTYSNAFLVPAKRKRNSASRVELRAAFDRLQAVGVENLHYLEGKHLFGDDNLGTVDGCHPTDLGFMRQADAFEKALRPILEMRQP